MKITIATGPIYPVPAVIGGSVQMLWHGLAKEFAKRGHEVTIFAKAYPGQPEHENTDGIRIVRWGGYRLTTSLAADLVKCLGYALGAVPRVPPGDVIVTNDFWTPALLPRLRPGAGRVFMNANRYPKHQFWMYGKVAGISAASGAVASEIRRQTPGLSGKVRVVPNAIDECFLEERVAGGESRVAGGSDGLAPSDLPPPIQGSASRGDGIPLTRGNSGLGLRLGNEQRDRGQLTVLYVGRIHPEKGVDLLLEAWTTALSKKGLGSLRESGAKLLGIVGPYKKEQGGGGEEYLKSLKGAGEGVRQWGHPGLSVVGRKRGVVRFGPGGGDGEKIARCGFEP